MPGQVWLDAPNRRELFMPFVTGHDSFEDRIVPDGASVWRYMDLARFVSMLEDASLVFPSAAVLQKADKWEGAFGPLNVQMRAENDDTDPPYGSGWTRWQRENYAKIMYINCWHVSEDESAAMWDIYQREGRGVAVRSTWGDLTASLTGTRDVYGGYIRYIDYETTLVEEYNGFNAFMYKRRSFEHEREARLIIQGGSQSEVVRRSDRAVPKDEGPVLKIPADLAG